MDYVVCRKYRTVLSVFFTVFLFFSSVGLLEAKSLYVSTTGSDSVTYADNDLDNPWLTVNKAFSDVEPGDNVYFRAGTYSITTQIITKYDKNPASSSEKITFSSYSEESVRFISALSTVISIDRDYYEVSNINFSAPGIFFSIGSDISAKEFKVSNCVGTLTVEGGAVNFAPVVFHPLATDSSVENCIFHGPGSKLNQNTAGVFVFRTQGLKVLNCEFYDFPEGIYYKHTCIGANTGIEFAYNYFEDCTESIRTVSQYAAIHDNIFNGCFMLVGTYGGTGDDGKNGGADYNNIYHNTFHNTYIHIKYGGDYDASGAQYNTVKDNLFVNTILLYPYSSNTSHHTTMNYNLYANSSVINNRTTYSLAGWKTFYGQDANSITGTPIYVGGTVPSTIAGYALTSSSDGYRSASDGEDMGADVALVGSSIEPIKNEIMPPAVLNIGQ